MGGCLSRDRIGLVERWVVWERDGWLGTEVDVLVERWWLGREFGSLVVR